jgi:hypothetical protein
MFNNPICIRNYAMNEANDSVMLTAMVYSWNLAMR